MRLPRPVLFALLAALVIAGCKGGGAAQPDAAPPTAVPTVAATETPSADVFLVGRPQTRAGIGDVDLAFDRYGAGHGDMVALYKEQPWFKDGLTREEALFVERGLSFVGRYSGPRTAYVSRETIQRKLYRYAKVPVASGEIELLLIYEPGQNADREMEVLVQVVPVLESLVQVEFPERVLTVINGRFEINDFNDGQFIRIANCCVNSASILAHELAHAYWSMAPSWFIEGMADLYSVMALAELNRQSPPGWQRVPADLESYYRSRKSAVDGGRFPNLILPRRLASDGLYEAADVFLLDIRRQVGDEAFRSAAHDIYLASDFGRYRVGDKRIEDIFLRYAKPDGREAIMALFNKSVWGDNGERYRELQELDGS